jgi:hypothetical protein
MQNRKRHHSLLRVAKTTKRGTFPVNKVGAMAQRAALYSTAYRLALEQIPSDQKRERPDISLRIHASIRRQLKAGAIDAHTIAFAALKDVLVPVGPIADIDTTLFDHLIGAGEKRRRQSQPKVSRGL